MKLINFRVCEFKSISDSNEVAVGDVTCLVGKNESGKTALLQALYRINPVNDSDTDYDVTDDYPRSRVIDYQRDVEAGDREPAIVIEATFRLEEELDAIHSEFGVGVLPHKEVILSKGYDNDLYFQLSADEAISGKAILGKMGLDSKPEYSDQNWSTLDDLSSLFTRRIDQIEEGFQKKAENTSATADGSADSRASLEADVPEELDVVKAARTRVDEVREQGLGAYLYHRYLEDSFPKFLYFDEYCQMRGCENIEALQRRLDDNVLQLSDYALLGLIELAGIGDLDELSSPSRTRELINRLEGAGNRLSREILDYWSQNRHLQLKFDVRPALPGDPDGMRAGTNLWTTVHDTKHFITTDIGMRSRGFVWFFSFLAWYSRLRSRNQKLVLLLDEPGLHLHPRAQLDLLRYFEQELKPNHQVIYTTHSPFMVDSDRFDRIRIVQDRSVDSETELPPDEAGTRVFVDAHKATEDSLFPLQGALAYQIIHQALLAGQNSLIVEGVSDLMYIQAISGILEDLGHEGLSPQWTIVPVGNANQVAAFIALMGAHEELRIATLIHFRKRHIQMIGSLFEQEMLEKSHILTFSHFTKKAESDIEDMFEPDFYLKVVNSAYAEELTKPIHVTALGRWKTRVLPAINAHLEAHPMKSGVFNQYRPARYFVENAADMSRELSAETLRRFGSSFKALNRLLDASQ